MFGNGKKTVAGITQSLTKIQNDLKLLEEETTNELKGYEVEKKKLDFKIDNANEEQTRGKTIFTNITNLLGGPVPEKPTVEK